MYYEEKIINGVLSHRSTPDGEWIPFTIEALSIAYISQQSTINSYGFQINNLKETLDRIKKLLPRD